MSITLFEMEQRLGEFLRCYGKRGAKPSLAMIGTLYWALGLEPEFVLIPRPERVMTADDLGVEVIPSPTHPGRLA